MKIIVLNGSPKGKVSITIQYIHFFQKKFPQHKFKILHISQKIKKLEKEESAFHDVINEIKSADGILWAFPLYFGFVQSNYKRFIELIFERAVENVFKNKYTAAFSTSIHFYDHIAHNYIRAICDDLNMKFIDSYSADMYDLLEKDKIESLTEFAENLITSIESKIPTSRKFSPLEFSDFKYIPGETQNNIDNNGKKILILTDLNDEQSNLAKMIEKFKSFFSNGIELINLHDINIKGGCLGCIRCAYNYECQYMGKDEYMEFYENKVISSDIIIFAGTIKDRYLSSRWKLYFDRSFFKNHSPTLMGKQIGLIISGPLRQISNLRQFFEGYFETQYTNLVDIVTDEYESSDEVDLLLENLAKRLIIFSDKKYIKPMTFMGFAGIKVFRDDIYGRLRFPFIADYKLYKKIGLYNFPKTSFKNKILGFLSKSKRFRKEVNKRIIPEMIKPLQKELKKLFPEN
ncbi:MAG: NAD(P)H-dependent oxidoreductase [Candidatus Helarchaeota archaeon]